MRSFRNISCLQLLTAVCGTTRKALGGAATATAILGTRDVLELGYPRRRMTVLTPEQTSRRCTCRNAKSRCDEPRLTAGHYQAGNCWQDTSRASFLNTMHPKEEKIMRTHMHTTTRRAVLRSVSNAQRRRTGAGATPPSTSRTGPRRTGGYEGQKLSTLIGPQPS